MKRCRPSHRIRASGATDEHHLNIGRFKSTLRPQCPRSQIYGLHKPQRKRTWRPKLRTQLRFWHMLWIVIKPLLFAVCFVFGCASLLAQKPVWQPSPRHTQVPIWPRTPPDAQFGPRPNTETMPEPGEVDNVSGTTMPVYSPKGKNTGAAVVVFPGGGYYVLAIDLEGTEVSHPLTSNTLT